MTSDLDILSEESLALIAEAQVRAEARTPCLHPGVEVRGTDGEDRLYADVAGLLADGHLDPPRPTVLARTDARCLLYAGEVNVLFGDSEAGKTWVAKAAIAEQLLAGGSALVIDVDHNGVRATVNHLLALGVPAETLSDQTRFRYTDADDENLLLRVVEDAKRWKPDIALVDCVGEVMAMLGLNSNSPDDYTRHHTMVPKPLASAGITTVIVDHLPKSPDTKAHGASGTHAKKRTVGGVMLRVKVEQQFTPGRGGSCYLTVHKDRHGGVRERCPTGEREPLAGKFVLTDRNGDLSWRITSPTKEESRQAEMDRTGTATDVAALRELDPPPASVADVKSRMRWGTNRAAAALKAWKATYPVPPPRGEERGTATSSCEVCGTERNVLRWERPYFTTRCADHNPITYKENT